MNHVIDVLSKYIFIFVFCDRSMYKTLTSFQTFRVDGGHGTILHNAVAQDDFGVLGVLTYIPNIQTRKKDDEKQQKMPELNQLYIMQWLKMSKVICHNPLVGGDYCEQNQWMRCSSQWVYEDGSAV
ncbi:uncharacterized protein LOC113312775 [Papaver somniferum]|uniref:uncharacterized protein LOC113312775 n=1 Tax=Papaver somniferum TaxID=3469 RepID=UPI000E70508F|nr:uncharacterized protein LOC113312775 [Papaver somniferum]